MEIGKYTYKQQFCEFRRSWVNQGLSLCMKGKDPMIDCENCEFLKEQEVVCTYASSEQ